MKTKKAEPDQISRSLLQKAVRRGDSELVIKTLAIIVRNNDFDWLSKRLAVITFEECWTFAFETKFTNSIEDVVSDYLTITKSVKNKNAAGLGSLAYELFNGDNSVLNFVSNKRPIRIIAEAIKKPNSFWKWLCSLDNTDDIRTFIKTSELAYKKASWPWDKAFCMAGAYLSVFEKIPLREVSNRKLDCPIWVGIDKHTKEGKVAINNAAQKLGIDQSVARWLNFYFEGVSCNDLEKSYWWDAEVNWRLRKMRLDKNSGLNLWLRLKPTVIELLDNELKKLNNKLEVQVEENLFKPNQPKLF